MTKEEIYDEQIAPLMIEIIKVCRENNIANICSFSLDNNVACTTCMTEDAFDPPEKFKKCVRILYG